MSCHHGAKTKPACSIRMRGIEAHEIAVVDEFATGLAAGVEACVAASALALQSQQAKAFDRTIRRRGVVCCQPNFEDRVTQRQKIIGERRRRRDKRCVRRRNHCVEARCNIVDSLAGHPGHQPSPRARRKAEDSEKFSWTPTLRADSPSAMPRSWVKYRIFTEVLRLSTFSART